MCTIHFYVVYMAIHASPVFHLRCSFNPFLRRHIRNPFLRRIHTGCYMIRRVKPIQPGRTLSPQLESGCSWCTDGTDPLYTTDSVQQGAILVVRYSGNGICQACVRSFKLLLTSSNWSKLRRSLLAEQPYCIHCRLLTKNTLACVVDHVIPWRYSPSLFWHSSNLQVLCRQCHDSKSLSERHL